MSRRVSALKTHFKWMTVEREKQEKDLAYFKIPVCDSGRGSEAHRALWIFSPEQGHQKLLSAPFPADFPSVWGM